MNNDIFPTNKTTAKCCGCGNPIPGCTADVATCTDCANAELDEIGYARFSWQDDYPIDAMFGHGWDRVVLVSPGAIDALKSNGKRSHDYLNQIVCGDLGERFNDSFRQEDPQAFEFEWTDTQSVLKEKLGMLHGVYPTRSGQVIWLLASLYGNQNLANFEFMLPSEY